MGCRSGPPAAAYPHHLTTSGESFSSAVVMVPAPIQWLVYQVYATKGCNSNKVDTLAGDQECGSTIVCRSSNISVEVTGANCTQQHNGLKAQRFASGRCTSAHCRRDVCLVAECQSAKVEQCTFGQIE